MIRTSAWLMAATVVGTAIGFTIPPSYACKVIGHSADGEPLCMTTSDGPGQPYTDGRSDGNGNSYWRWQERRREDFRRRQGEGRAAWQDNGTPSSVGTISPFVPGSTQDIAWKAERKRHGID